MALLIRYPLHHYSHLSTYLTGENDLFLPLDFLFISGVLGLLCACAVNAFGFSDVSILKLNLKFVGYCETMKVAQVWVHLL